MSLLKKASIITTPTAYAEDYLYSIKPAYALGSELVTNGTFDTDSDWGKGNGWTISGGKANRSGESGNSPITQNVSVVNGRKYTFSYTRKYLSGSSGYTNIFVKLDNVNYSTIGAYISTVVEEHIVTGEFTALFTGNLLWAIYGIGDFTGYVDNVSIKEVTDADFDFDRNSTGTRVNEDYLIEDVPYNLSSYSEDFSNSYWTKTGATVESGFLAPYGSLNAYKLVEGTNNGIHIMNRILTVVNAQVYSTSIFVKSAERTKFGMRDGFSNKWITVNLSNGSVIASNGLISSEITKAANDWHKISFTLTTASTSATLKVYTLSDSYTSGSPETYFYQGDGSSGVYIWGAQVVKGDQPKDYLKTTDRLDIPRIDYTNGEPSILLEPSRTNLFEYDIDFSQVHWTKQNVTLQSNNAISPEGIQNASNIYPTTNVAYIYNTTTASSSVYTISAYVKANGKNVAWLYVASSSANGTIYFDLSDESVQVVAGSGGTPIGTINKMPNGWYRITYTTGSSISFTGGAGVGVSDAKGSFNATQNGTDGILVYGLQLEAGSYATSLIHTSGSTVTRSADAANNAGNSDLINSTEGVFYAEIKANTNDEAGRQITLSSGSTANNVQIKYTANDNRIDGSIKSGNVSQGIMHHTLSTVLEYHKVAIKYKANDFALFIDGKQVDTDSTGSAPVGLKQLNFDNGNSQNDFLGNCKMVAVFKEALTDLELEKLTGYNNHELYMNYYNRLSYLGLAEEYNVESDINNYIL
jgi:hypothetical protein